MTKYFLERRQLTQVEMTADITRHLQVRQMIGKAVVVTERPVVLLSSVRRQWMKIAQALQRESSRTLDASLKAELSRQIDAMQNLRFVAKSPEDEPDVDVYFIDTESTDVLPKTCRTVYFCAADIPSQALKNVEPGVVVVQYSE